MTGLLRRHSLALTASLLLITTFQLMSASIARPELPRAGSQLISWVTAPFERLTSELFTTANFYWSRYLYLIDVEGENVALRAELADVKRQYIEAQEHRHENDRLRALLQYRDERGARGVVATVVSRDPSNWGETIGLNRGADQGIAVGMPVVAGHSVAGQVVAVTGGSSRVLLLTDNTSAVSAVVQRNRAPGIIEGRLGEPLEMKYVEAKYDIEVGDTIVASGVDGIYPKGTRIGVVSDVQTTRGQLFTRVVVTPAVDMDRIETVLVLTDSGTPQEEVVGDSIGDAPVDPSVVPSAEVPND